MTVKVAINGMEELETMPESILSIKSGTSEVVAVNDMGSPTCWTIVQYDSVPGILPMMFN
jgi:hypothetical protein